VPTDPTPDSRLTTQDSLLVIVGGPNGCGKTTFAVRYSGMKNLKYLGADLIAGRLNPANPLAAAVKAGRLFSSELAAALSQGESLVVESTLSGLSLRKPIRLAADRGYRVKMVFVYLDAPEACLARVRERVAKGGHNVPQADIARRFSRSLRNFWQVYRLMATDWSLFYNGGKSAVRVASSRQGTLSVADEQAFADFLRLAE
jgi:predicted ABC-type ATPase